MYGLHIGFLSLENINHKEDIHKNIIIKYRFVIEMLMQIKKVKWKNRNITTCGRYAKLRRIRTWIVDSLVF